MIPTPSGHLEIRYPSDLLIKEHRKRAIVFDDQRVVYFDEINEFCRSNYSSSFLDITCFNNNKLDVRKGHSMAVRFIVMAVLFAGSIWSSFSQAISFNTPLPWVSLRNDTIIVRAQVDTAVLKGKQLSLTLATVKNGKSQTIASKLFPVKDPSGEFSFGKIKKKLVGGDEFLRVKWEVKSGATKKAAKDAAAASAAEEKGVLEPIGIADISDAGKTDTVRAAKVPDDKKLGDVAAAVGDKFQQTGSVSYAFAWNKNALFAVVKKGSTKDVAKFAFDGKSGKNAFLSYPDRIVTCAALDSVPVKGIHFEREIRKDSLIYKELAWQNELTHEVVGDKIVIRIPWFDTGMIPFEDRTIGFGAFIDDAKGKTAAALPASAKFFIPATWGVLYLQK